MAKKKILIVDDDPGILTMLKLMLRLEGYEAIVCEEALNVLDMLTAEKPDLVLLDAMMPQLDALAVLDRIQQNISDKPPIILFTGKADEAYINKALNAGASTLLMKPFVKEELLEKLQSFLGK